MNGMPTSVHVSANWRSITATGNLWPDLPVLNGMTGVTESPVPATEHLDRDVRATASTPEKTKEGHQK
jgi:hypothetical protein